MNKQRFSVFSAFYPFRGGIAQFNARLFRALENKVHINAFTFRKQYPDFLFPGTSQFVTAEDQADAIPAKRIVSTFNPFSYVSGIRNLRKVEPDVFIANYWMSFFGLFLGLFAAFLPKKVKKVAILHNLVPHEKRFFDAPLNRFFVKRYQGFVVMSDSVEKDLKKMRPDAKVLRVDHPWYDHFGSLMDKKEARRMLKVAVDKKTLLFFGIIRPYKGLDLLIQAFDMLPEDYQLVIAGEVYGSSNEYHQQVANSSGRERIHFINRYISDGEVHVFFSAADACVLPYRTATQSGITATSFHFEVPMVVTDVGGLASIVGDGYMGVVAKEVTPISISNGVKQLFEENNYLQCQENIRKEKEKNTWEAFAQRLVDFSTSLPY